MSLHVWSVMVISDDCIIYLEIYMTSGSCSCVTLIKDLNQNVVNMTYLSKLKTG